MCYKGRCKSSRRALSIGGILLFCALQPGVRFQFHGTANFKETIEVLNQEEGEHGMELADEQRNATIVGSASLRLPWNVATAGYDISKVAQEKVAKKKEIAIQEHNADITAGPSSKSAPPLLASSESATAPPVALQRVESSPFMVNNIMTTQKPVIPDCHRRCVDYRNKIYIPFQGEWRAGLIDRLLIIASVLNMAGYLCARLYLPRPKFLLDSLHNANTSLDARATWSEFGNFSFWNNPSANTALVDWTNPLNLEHHPIIKYLFNDTNANLINHTRIPTRVIHQFQVFEQYTMAQQEDLLSNKRTSKQRGSGAYFIWILQARYYNWDNALAKHLQTRQLPNYYASEVDRQKEPLVFARRERLSGCQYAKVELPHHLQKVREAAVTQVLRQLSSSLSQPSSAPSLPASSVIFGYFHIRRSDSKGECDTSLSSIKSYLNCSFADAISRLSMAGTHSGRRMVVLFSSDEREEQYRQDVARLIEGLGQHDRANAFHITAMDLDYLVRQKVQAEVDSGRFPAWRINNYYLFQLVLLIGYNQSITQFRLEKRRFISCAACANVTAQLIQSGVLDDV